MRKTDQDFHVLCAGRLYCDLIFTEVPRVPTLGTEVFADGLGCHAGGGAFITAAHLSELGCKASLAAMLPPDPFGQIVSSDFQAADLDTSLCKTLLAASGPQITVAMSSGSDRAFLTRKSGPPIPNIDADDIARSGASHLHIGELATLIERPGIISAARKAGLSVSLDCGWDDDFDIRDIAGLIEMVDVFLPNEMEAQLLMQLGLELPLANLTVIKQGAYGATAHTDGHIHKAPTTPIVAKDTTGAGDAFNAGFLRSWLRRRPLPECLDSGNRQGASAVQSRGGFAPKTASTKTGKISLN